MSLMELWRKIDEACEIGKQLEDPTKWADKATRTGIIAHILTLLIGVAGGFGYALDIRPSDVQGIALGISTIIAVGMQWAANRMHTASNPNAGRK